MRQDSVEQARLHLPFLYTKKDDATNAPSDVLVLRLFFANSLGGVLEGHGTDMRKHSSRAWKFPHDDAILSTRFNMIF